MFKRLMSTTNDGALTILRLMLGVVFFAHGSQKMLGWFGGYGLSGTMHFFTDMMHIPAPFAFLAIAAEFFGGIGLILGLLTRVAAFGIACILGYSQTGPEHKRARGLNTICWQSPSRLL